MRNNLEACVQDRARDGLGDMSISSTALTGIGRHSVIYGIGSAISVAAGIVMLPVYTHALTPAEYGVLELCLRFITISMALAFLGLRQGFIRLYYDSGSAQSVSSLVITTLIANFAMALFAAVVFFGISLFTDVISASLDVPASWPVLATLWLAMESAYLVALSWFQVRMQSVAFVIIQAMRLLLLVGLNIVFLNVFDLGLRGALLGNLVASLVFGAVATIALIVKNGISYSRDKLGELIMFGWPYVPVAAFGYAMGNADRVVLAATGAITSLGLLSLASKIGEMGLSIFITPVERVWAPFVFAVYNKPDGPSLIGRVFTQYAALSVLLAISISLGAPLLVSWFTSPEYEPAVLLVPVVAFSGIFSGLASLMDIGILIAKKTSYKLWIVASGAAATIILQILFIPAFGVVGAAVASALGNVILLFIVRGIAIRHYQFVTRKMDFIKIGICGLTSFLLGKELQSISMHWVWQIFGAMIGVSVYMGSILMMRVTNVGEIAQLFRRSGSDAQAS